jgi:2-polyprenyl-6-methoxyphenol hydroxylase-like FAD-dependent oxidoreductase
MRVIVVGAGPAGLFTAIALARQGHRVTLVDRDSGPPEEGRWQRNAVMQFHHPHTFRGPVVDILGDEMPDVLAHLTDTGAVIATAPDGRPAALLCRRSTFDAVLRACAAREPLIALETGHVDGVTRRAGRVTGVHTGGRQLTADLVVDASGRSSRFTDGLRPAAEGGDCGVVYVSRQYQMAATAAHAPTNTPIGLSLSFAEYFAIAFQHDSGTFSVTLAHDGRDDRLRRLRHAEVFESVVRSIPVLAEWIDPRRSHPITAVLPGGRTYNSYRGQLLETGTLACPGMISVGDAVCTTTPLAGRGVTLALTQARALSRCLREHSHDIDSAAGAFDAWCTSAIRPWFEDHRHADADRLRRWGGGDVDTSRRLPSDLIVAAAAVDERLRGVTERFARMDTMPSALDAVEPLARETYALGWRPPVAEGPTRDELAMICAVGAVAPQTFSTPVVSRPPVAV